MHKAASLSKKDARSKGLSEEANPSIYKPFYLKPILLETPRSTQIKYPLHWLVFLAVKVLCVAFEIIFSPQRYTWSSSAAGSGLQHLCQGQPRTWVCNGHPMALPTTSCTGMWFLFPFS